MGLTLHNNRAVILLLVTVLSLGVGYCHDFIRSRASHYNTPDGLGNPNGACGYGEDGRLHINNGLVAAVHRPYRDGTGCGACYQVRCLAKEFSQEGVEVVATDWGVGDWVDFIFSPQAYNKMAQAGCENELRSYHVVDIEYRRILCRYDGSTLLFKIHEPSVNPHYLALIITCPAGVYDVIAVQVWQEDCKEWTPMRKPYGAVWDMENPPRGELSLRFRLASADDIKWVEARNVIHADWKAGDAYETNIEL